MFLDRIDPRQGPFLEHIIVIVPNVQSMFHWFKARLWKYIRCVDKKNGVENYLILEHQGHRLADESKLAKFR